MAKILVLVIAVCLCLAGCTAKYDEKFTLFETRTEDHESRLNNLESRADLLTEELEKIKEEKKKLIDEKKELLTKSSINNLSNQNIQAALKNAGFYDGPIDGKLGPKTQTAIKKFQKANNVKIDGVIGKETRNLLIKSLPEEAY